jgi:hypothetical protein
MERWAVATGQSWANRRKLTEEGIPHPLEAGARGLVSSINATRADGEIALGWAITVSSTGRCFRAVTSDVRYRDKSSVTALGVGREVPYQNVRAGLAIGAGAALSGSPTASELRKDPTKKKEVWLFCCFAAFQTLSAAVRRASIGNILHLAVDCRVYPNSSIVVTALGFRSKACRFS